MSPSAIRSSAPRPRVLQVLFSYQLAGSEVFGLELSRHLVQQGVEVLCAAVDETPGPLLARCAEYGIQPVALGIPTRSILGRNGISRRLVSRIRELRLDAIHLQHFLALHKLWLAAPLARVPIIVTEHSVENVDCARAARVRARLLWRLVTRIAVIHPSISEYLRNRIGVPAERMEVIPICIDLETYHPQDRAACRAKLELGPEVVFVFVGRLVPVKNVPGLIGAFLEVQSQGAPPATLLVVGDGEERRACEQLIQSHPHGKRVRIVGLQADPRPFVAAGDVFIMNSHSEGTPRALLEAMAMGLPGLCPAVGGIPDILRERGWLTVPDDPRSLQEAIHSVLSHPEQTGPLGARCRDYVRANFDPRRIAARYRELLLGKSDD